MSGIRELFIIMLLACRSREDRSSPVCVLLSRSLLISLVAKVTHPDITARIRCMQVLYVNGEDKLPWIVIATSNGTVQVWNLAAFKFDALAPEEANVGVAPVTSTTLLSKPRLTCLSACIANEGVTVPAEKKAKKVKKAASAAAAGAKSASKATAAAAAAAPRVVVELDEDTAKAKTQAGSKSQKRSADDTSDTNKQQKKEQQQQQAGGKNKKSKKHKSA